MRFVFHCDYYDVDMDIFAFFGLRFPLLYSEYSVIPSIHRFVCFLK